MTINVPTYIIMRNKNFREKFFFFFEKKRFTRIFSI